MRQVEDRCGTNQHKLNYPPPFLAALSHLHKGELPFFVLSSQPVRRQYSPLSTKKARGWGWNWGWSKGVEVVVCIDRPRVVPTPRTLHHGYVCIYIYVYSIHCIAHILYLYVVAQESATFICLHRINIILRNELQRV